MRNIAVKIMYDGGGYHGWQTQPNGITVQERMEKVLSELTGEIIAVCGCSRTDSGVHALEYVFNFKSNTGIPAERLPYAINTHLGNDGIAAVAAKDVSEDFSARFSSDGKRYVYKIWNSTLQNPFTAKYSWFVPYRLDVENMKIAAEKLCGKHDFSAFMAAGGSQKTTVRTIRECVVKESTEWREQLEVEVEADAFLYNMVRIITGTLVEVGTGRKTVEDIEKIIRDCDRRGAGMTAPPEGLFLKKVFYKPELLEW
ncbi:MAG: tRNA pseudouridine(38-40) synthase TruA [Clostridia bacterium]|nr:tRNA pseudouridine(38-40) synthase TruA [Oscillospiraceae bacterium]MBQ7959825.1 tRNA pseudouridine(38-40) synthase TruA [Clostridia bacterium]